MQELITSFLVQSKECNLPGLGKFRIITTPAELDIANKRLLPPTDEILFTGRADKNSEDLIKYISWHKNITPGEALHALTDWCAGVKEQLSAGKKMVFGSIGVLQKNTSGNISFSPAKSGNFFEPVPAERIIRKNLDHAILVGDKETTSSVMNQYLSEETTARRSTWKIIALVLLLIALTVLAIEFYSRSFSGVGNQSKHWPADPSSTYSTR